MNRAAPREIRNSRARRELVLNWTVDLQQSIPYQRLRGHCPCSRCRAARVGGQSTLVDEAVQVESVNLFPYGVQLVFSDGHERGIFPWGYLFDL